MTSARPRHPWRLLRSLAAFVALSSVLTLFVVNSVLDLNTGGGETYHALVPDAAGLRSGDNVAVAGLESGKVSAVELVDEPGEDKDLVRITFTLAEGQAIHSDTRTAVRYANLIGNRYLALVPPEDAAPGPVLKPGSTLPAGQNMPAIDLTAVFDGFQPLFDALDPEEVNELTSSLISIFQGQTGTVSNLVDQIGTITTNLADQKDVISDVITNLADLLRSTNKRRDSVGDMIDSVDTIVGSLSGQRETLQSTIDGLATFTENAATLTEESMPDINAGITGVTDAAEALADNADSLNGVIKDLPSAVRALNRITDSGSFIKVYLCNLDLRVTGKLNLSLVPGVRAPQDPKNLQLPSGTVGDPSQAGAVCR